MRKLSDVDFINYVQSYDVIFLTETWLTKTVNFNCDIQGYTCEHIFGNKSAGVKKGRFSGGISIYYKNCFKDKIKVLEKNQSGLMWIKISKDVFSFVQDVYICITYIPPSGSKVLKSQDVDLFEQLELGVTKYKHLGKVFITGDFNSRTSSESDCLDFDKYLDDEDIFLNDIVLQPRVNSDHVLDTHGRRLLLLCQISGLLIANGRVHEDSNIGEHTFVSLNGLSTVDYLLANPLDILCLSNFKILNFNEFSDHAPLFFSMPCDIPQKPVREQNSRAELKIVLDESKADIFRSELVNNNETLLRLTGCVDNCPVDSVVSSFTDYMYATTALVYGKELQVKENSFSNCTQNKWFNHQCSEAKSEYKKARNIFMRHKNDTIRQRFVSARTKFNRIKRNAKQNYKQKEGKHICDMAKKQPRKFWKAIKRKFKSNPTQSETLSADDLLTHFKKVFCDGDDAPAGTPHNPITIPPQWQHSYRTNSQSHTPQTQLSPRPDSQTPHPPHNQDPRPDSQNPPPSSQLSPQPDSNPRFPITPPQSQPSDRPDSQRVIHIELDAEITEAELKEAVFHQKNNKCPGPDNLKSELFKISFDIISPFLLKLYNRLFRNGEYPRAWGDGIIVPIFKSGNIDEAHNYRGITLINILAKIYSQILLNRLTKWSEKENKLSQNQFGFQKGKSTIDCIFAFYSILSKTLHSGEKLYCAFIDYEKAFDKIDRNLLWQKLASEHVSTKLVRAISSMYAVVKSCIRYKSSLSGFLSSHIGLKQGDPSSPMMFMMFINDTTQYINSDFNSIFTIDEFQLFMLLYADDAVVFAKSPDALQSILNDLELYCRTWGLKINTSKTKAMIFEKGRHTIFDFYLNNTKLELVNSFKYLGIHFFKNGNLFRTQKRIAEHASYALHNLFSLFNQIELPISEKCKLFDTLVGSILNYGGEVIGSAEAKNIELIHTKFCRWILHVRKSTNLTGLYGELGRVPFIVTRKIRMINYWNKLLNLDENSVPKRIYMMLKNDADNNITYSGANWAFRIKSLLNELGLTYVWLQQNERIIPFSLIKQRILDCYKQSWYANINNSNRLLMYSRFKHDFAFENYLDFIQEKKFKIALTKFRLSSHDLAIERGRFENVNRDNRLCKHCNLNMVENEYHFLLVCPLYRDLRKKYLQNYYCHWPTLNKFDDLMRRNSKSTVLNLSKFLHFATKLRNSLQLD